VDEKTKYRDAWADSKQVTLPQVFQATANVTQEVSRSGLELDRLVQRLARSTLFREFYAGVERLAELSRSVAYNVHNLKLLCDLQVPPSALFTDHYVNQFYLMSAMKRTWWVEGPAFCGLAVEPGSRILDLGCGTGYYTDVFFSPFAAEIVAIDIDARAIETARRMHQAKNIRYEVMDFRKTLPDGLFDLIVWTPTIFAYTPDDVHTLMGKLRDIMSKDARLCGWTCIESPRGGPDILWHDMNSLAERLKRYFKNVRAFERIHTTVQPPRHELFFFASDGTLPFDKGWPHGVRLAT
jgi:SAM-dependent methyltransferase